MRGPSQVSLTWTRSTDDITWWSLGYRIFADGAPVWRKRGTELALGVGIEAGYATLGRIGFEGRYDDGAVGPVANLASRLSTHATPGQTLIGQRLFAAVEAAVEVAPAGELELKGFARPVPAFAVLALR